MAKEGKVLEQKNYCSLSWEPLREQKWVVLFFFTSSTMTVYSNIQFVKSGQKIWAGPSPPLNWTTQKNSYFFRETFPKRTLGANNFISSNILCKIFEPLNHHACNSIPNILGSSILNPFRCLKMSNGEFYDFWQLKKSNGDRTKV